MYILFKKIKLSFLDPSDNAELWCVLVAEAMKFHVHYRQNIIRMHTWMRLMFMSSMHYHIIHIPCSIFIFINLIMVIIYRLILLLLLTSIIYHIFNQIINTTVSFEIYCYHTYVLTQLRGHVLFYVISIMIWL